MNSNQKDAKDNNEHLNHKKHSDFFMKLHGLKEKIDLFNEVFKKDETSP